MDSLLQEINMLPSVLGCFVYTAEQQIAGSKMPPIFKENNIKTIGGLLARINQMGGMAELHFTDIEIKYNESLIVITPLTKGALLVIICEPNANKSLINMTTGMLSRDIEAAMAQGITGTPVSSGVPAPKTQTAAPQPAAQAAPPKEAEIDAALAPVLEQVKDALALAIGPIASPVMKDTIEVWAQQGAPSMATLPALAKLLCDEINDEDLEEEFMAELKNISS
jgi:predicted regulator of Ras-like GTPase activity (Roadblock/LC7/MglB family)